MKKEYYKDFYGCTSSIQKVKNGFRLISCTPQGVKFVDRIYPSHDIALRTAKGNTCELRKAE